MQRTARFFSLVAALVLATPVFAGYLFVGNASSGVNRYNATSGAFVGTLSVPSGSGFLGGLAVSGNSLFVAGQDDNAIFQFDATTGAYLGIFTSAGLDRPTGIAFGPDGNLYVANQAGGSSFVNRYNGTTGALLSTFVAAGAGPVGGLFNPQGITFGPDGNLYVSDTSSGSIAQFNGTTAAYASFVAAGNPPSPLSSPYGLVFGPDGNLYVADAVTSTVLRYNGSTGAYIGEFVGLAGGLVQPIGLAFGPDGNLYVADGQARVASFNGTTGALIGDFVSIGSGGLTNPQYIAFSSDIPEPGTAALLGTGLLLGLFWKRRRG